MPEPQADHAPASILVAMLPASDLAVSAAFYCRLLDLELLREFVVAGEVTGCSLGRADLPYALGLRLRSTLPGPAELRGEHPVIWRLTDQPALERFRQHAARLGLNPSTRRHDDADLVCIVDPDGHDVLVGFPLRDWTEFCGYELSPDGWRHSYGRSRLLEHRQLDTVA